ncbi:hypothetical protein L208DRAFT_1388872 [Tricholoma matsutake]|nr:hypothetical protein L208DRAFT_1388872 [Tricholoma matsutake 945]
MTVKSPTISTLNSLVFADSWDIDGIENLERRIENFESCRTDDTKVGCRRPSIYVEAFEDMVNRVHEFEHHLLTEKEWDVLSTFSTLCYNARYCLVRLLLRKADRWHTEASMETFTKEVSEEGLRRALVDLCLPFTTPVKKEGMELEMDAPVKEEPETIDLSFDSEEKEDQKWAVTNEAGPSRLGINSFPECSQIDMKPKLDDVFNHLGLDLSDPDIDFFCRDQTTMTLHEVLNKLGTEELKDLVKSTKVRPRKSVKAEMISALMSHASTQSILVFKSSSKVVKGKRKARDDDGLRQTKLPFVPTGSKGKGKAAQQTQEGRLMEMALGKLGTCVTLNPYFYELIERINILDERATQFPKSLLLPALLTCFRKRKYPDYKHTRTSNIWSSREELMHYVAALELEAVFDQATEPQNTSRKPGTKTPGPHTFVTPATPGPGRNITTPLRTPRSSLTAQYTPASIKKETADKEAAESIKGDQESVMSETLAKLDKAKRIKEIFDTLIIPRWTGLVAAKQDGEARVRPTALERFEPGFVYTRLFRRVQDALRTLRDYQGEAEVLEALLGQRYWRRRKRGAWYERRAILQTRYLCQIDGVKDDSMLLQTMEGVQEALKDEDTGLVFRPSLLRRLRTMEKKLKIPEVQRAVAERELRKAKVVSFSAVRLEKPSTSLRLGTSLQYLSGEGNGEDVRKYFPPTTGSSLAEKEKNPEVTPPAKKPKMTGKSLWRGKNGEELNVETRALQHYESLGYKGFHSESRILTTIFALLFWDIIFADIPGAFETPYQTAPLDLTEETFYYARKEMIDTRLDEIKQGQAREVLERHDDAHREKNTWCAGVQWDICGKQDLVEIVECLGGESLSIICRLFCEDYAGRSSGVPDLVVWNAKLRTVTFVEVKGPGDRPQENQKLWFDSLLNAGADVEICQVLDSNNKTDTSKTKKKRKSSKSAKGKMKPTDSDFLDDEDQFANQSLALNPDPSSSSRKRARPPDSWDESPSVFSPTSSPKSPLAPASGRASVGFSSKKPRFTR